MATSSITANFYCDDAKAANTFVDLLLSEKPPAKWVAPVPTGTAAGYTDEMKRFMELNPGLKSRFTRTIEFPDYTAYELAEIFFKMAEDGEYVCTPKIKEAVVDAMNDIITNKGKDFGNGRVARNFYEEAIKKLAKRIAAESGQLKNGNKRIRLLTRFTVGDIKSALQTIEMNLRNGASKKGT